MKICAWPWDRGAVEAGASASVDGQLLSQASLAGHLRFDIVDFTLHQSSASEYRSGRIWFP